MTANTSPIFTLSPVIGCVQVSTANTAVDGTGTMGTVVTGGTNGTRISRLVIQSSGSSNAAGMIRFFIENSGSTVLYKEVSTIATTRSATVQAYRVEVEMLAERALVLPSGYVLKVSTEKPEIWNIFAEGGEY